MTEDLFCRAQQGDKAALEILTEENIRLVHSVAQRFRGRGTEYEDLVQLGSIGLINAIKRFDISRGYCFSTYAVPLIMGEIRKSLRDDGIIKVSRRLRENAVRAHVSVNKLRAKLGREPTINEISSDSGIPLEELAQSLEATRVPESLYGDEEGVSAIDTFISDSLNEDGCLERISILKALSKMEKRDKMLIINRYFRDKTQAETAKELGISQVQVSRCEKKLLETLKNELK
ncbi:MAG: sigma-70 family RNA polymerase sigma factor [Clostridia bacterium]|nr:sigma-70 family RNA polymerase sigma factor [Clostridia bacterium]